MDLWTETLSYIEEKYLSIKLRIRYLKNLIMKMYSKDCDQFQNRVIFNSLSSLAFGTDSGFRGFYEKAGESHNYACLNTVFFVYLGLYSKTNMKILQITNANKLIV